MSFDLGKILVRILYPFAQICTLKIDSYNRLNKLFQKDLEMTMGGMGANLN